MNTGLYSVDGTLVASAYEGYDVLFPHPGWAEQDPSLWIKALHSTIRQVLAHVPPDAVKAISFGSQLDGMVVCDKKGAPLRNALIWMDRRAEAQAAAFAQRVSREDFYHHVGTNLDSSHAVFKALWVRDEEPDAFASARRLMPPGSFVLHEAAGVAMVDFSNASSLALLDPTTREWSGAIVEAAGLDIRMLPELALVARPLLRPRLRVRRDLRPRRRRGAWGGRTRLPPLHAGRDGAGVEWRRARRLLRLEPRPHPGAHDARSPRRQRVRPARHPGGDAERRPRRPPPDHRRRRRERSAVAADQG